MTSRIALTLEVHRAIRKAEAHKQKEFKMNTTETNQRALISAAWYLRRHDFVILEQNWECKNGTADIIAMERDALVFVKVEEVTDDDKAFKVERKPSAKHRAKWENMAFEYLASHDYSDIPLRFDEMEIKKLDEDRCMIKHHVNALGVA